MGEMLRLEAGMLGSAVPLNLLGIVDPAREEAAAEGRVGDKADAQFSSGLQRFLCLLTVE
jgi:hypothetical protein